MIIIEDALSANAPHIKELQRHKFRFILGVKPGDHSYLFNDRVAIGLASDLGFLH